MSAPMSYLVARRWNDPDPPPSPWVIVTGLGTDEATGRDVVSVYATHRQTGEVRESRVVMPEGVEIDDAMVEALRKVTR